MGDKLRVLVIDDSSYNRRAITEILESHPDIEVVATAVDGEQGLKTVNQVKPDLITLDIEMPRMDGFTFLRMLMSQLPTPVIMISSHARKQEVFQALELGALDFIAKPDRFFSAESAPVRRELIAKALAVRNLQVVPFQQGSARGLTLPPPEMETGPSQPFDRIVALGASTGGPPALQSLFKSVGTGGSAAFVVAQHMPEKFTEAFAARLNRMASLEICEAGHQVPLEAGHAYIAPGGKHLEIGSDGKRPICLLVDDDQSQLYVPSIDRLFTSLAANWDGPVLAAVLTGMGVDGSQGVKAIREKGGYVIAESDETAIVYGMPKSAVATGQVNEVLPLGQLITKVHEFSQGTTPVAG